MVKIVVFKSMVKSVEDLFIILNCIFFIAIYLLYIGKLTSEITQNLKLNYNSQIL